MDSLFHGHAHAGARAARDEQGSPDPRGTPSGAGEGLRQLWGDASQHRVKSGAWGRARSVQVSPASNSRGPRRWAFTCWLWLKVAVRGGIANCPSSTRHARAERVMRRKPSVQLFPGSGARAWTWRKPAQHRS